MSVAVTFNGSLYIIPTNNDVGWGTNLTNYLVAIAAGSLQKTAGTFLLSAELDFGAAFGLKALYYKSRTANIADAGIIRLANNSDSIAWRNFANSGNLLLNTNVSNELVFNGQTVLTGASPTLYVASITGTANQVIASSPTGAVTLSLPQNIGTSSAVQFGTLGLGAAVDASAILSASSTTKGFLPPRMTQAQRDLIATPATGLTIYNTDSAQLNYYNGTVWVVVSSGGGSGTVNVGTANTLAYYPASTNTVDDLPAITASRALVSDSNGLPIASVTTAAELAFVSGVTSAIQTQLNLKAPLASPTFTGTVTIPTPFTLGATSVTATGTEMNYLVGVTSSIQTQINSKQNALTTQFGYRRPNLTFQSVTEIDIENNTGTANETSIVFPDGTVRSVTENTGVTTKYRRFNITETAEFTSGTENSGLRSGLSETTNTWYAIYVVKSQINAANFVLVGDTTLPLQTNFSTLNSTYGTNSWYYVGMIRNGDNSGATGDILTFVQTGPKVVFINACDPTGVGSFPIAGLTLATGTGTVTYTYSAGTGSTNIPDQLKIVDYMTALNGATSSAFIVNNSGSTRRFMSLTAFTPSLFRFPVNSEAATQGITIISTSNNGAITCSGFVDSILSAGINPVL